MNLKYNKRIIILKGDCNISRSGIDKTEPANEFIIVKMERLRPTKYFFPY